MVVVVAVVERLTLGGCVKDLRIIISVVVSLRKPYRSVGI